MFLSVQYCCALSLLEDGSMVDNTPTIVLVAINSDSDSEGGISGPQGGEGAR